MTTFNNLGPYAPTPDATDSDNIPGPGSPTIETTFVASEQLVDIGNGLGATTHAEVFNGAIPGPTLRLNVNDTVVVRLVNDLTHETGIHWHGVELANHADGTEVTQDGAPGGPIQLLGGVTPAGGTFLYKFKVTRPGLFWYHPHHGNSSNRVFRGMYGMIVVTDPAEAAITDGVVLPASTPAETMQIVLSDTTVCKAPGQNDATTYPIPNPPLAAADQPEWLSGDTAQFGTSPRDLCEIPTIPPLPDTPYGTAKNDDGTAAVVSYGAGDIPSIMRGPVLNEGQTVLTNGVDVGGRFGTPAAPRALAPGAAKFDVLSGQGLRLQIVNCAHLRYFRLRLTTGTGVPVPLVRIGGEGGLLDNAILEGGTMGTFDTEFESGEILLPPATRADVVAAIPAGILPGLPNDQSVLTLWTRDYQRTGGGAGNANRWAQLPSVPVMHLRVTGPKLGPAYEIVGGDVNVSPPPASVTSLRVPAGLALVEDIKLAATTGVIFNPVPAGKTGNVSADIQMQTSGGVPNIDGVPGVFTLPAGPPVPPMYAHLQHLGSTRYAPHVSSDLPFGKLLELTVTNTTNAHHPFHLHGFSFQPKLLAPMAGAPAGTTGTYQWSYQEFRDTIDLPPHHTLTFRVRLDPRMLSDDVTQGGALGRWLFHCHIFFHHMQGMISELVVTTTDGKEKPNIKVGGSWAYGGLFPSAPATRSGFFHSPEGLPMTLTATKGTVSPAGSNPGGVWTWQYGAVPNEVQNTEYVYITATDNAGRKDQAVFRLQMGSILGTDTGDPHIHTVDGKNYDFQAAGEFTLLRDREGMEIQVRQTPALTPPPIPDAYSGLTECVSLNTAMAALVGSHRIAYLPVERGRFRFFVDGKAALLTTEGVDLEGHRVSAFDANGVTGLRIDYENDAVVTVTPHLWTSYGLWYLNISVSHTQADEGIMGRIPKGSWLPTLPSGATVGPKPANPHDVYVALYRTFADAWRVTDETSLFVYLPGTSTATFTDRDWPAEKLPCSLKPGFQKPATPIRVNIDVKKAGQICRGVTMKDLHANCVFDVATTGDPEFAKTYLIAQDLRLRSSAVQIVGNKPQTKPGQSLVITATVLPLTFGRPTPMGAVTFIVDGVPMKRPAKLDKYGRARLTLTTLKMGAHTIRGAYTPDGGRDSYYPSSSPNLLHMVTDRRGYPVTIGRVSPMPMGGMSPMLTGGMPLMPMGGVPLMPMGRRPSAKKARGSTRKRDSKAGRRSKRR